MSIQKLEVRKFRGLFTPDNPILSLTLFVIKKHLHVFIVPLKDLTKASFKFLNFLPKIQVKYALFTFIICIILGCNLVDIMEINRISFGAKPINDVTIKKWDRQTKKFTDCPAKFVKIDSENPIDLSVLNTLAQKWKGAKYIQRIATASHWMNIRKYVEIDVYALTSQQKDFERLRQNKILGVVEMRNDPNDSKNRKVWYLQVKPSVMNVNNQNNKYEKAGTSILDSLKKIYTRMSLYADDDKNIQKFYKKNGFIEDYQGRNHYSWSSNIFERLRIRINAYIRKNGF